jgi:hypothetical protein
MSTSPGDLKTNGYPDTDSYLSSDPTEPVEADPIF